MASQVPTRQGQQVVSNQQQGPAALKTFQYKLVLLGESAVGKSSLVLRFVKGQFHEYQESTIGAAFLTQSITLDDAIIKFEIWDTAGQERYHSLAPMYYRGAQAAIVMYDITNRDSFSRAQTWISELQKQASPNIIMAVAANKIDLDNLRSVTTEEGESFAKEHGLLFLETSAKNATNVNEIFISIAKKLPRVSTTTQPGARGQGGVNLEGEQRTTPGGGCCT